MFAQFCTAFLKSTFNFEQCGKKDAPHSSCFSEVIDREKRGYVNVQRVMFQYTLGQATC